jgi:hypothetical protein
MAAMAHVFLQDFQLFDILRELQDGHLNEAHPLLLLWDAFSSSAGCQRCIGQTWMKHGIRDSVLGFKSGIITR